LIAVEATAAQVLLAVAGSAAALSRGIRRFPAVNNTSTKPGGYAERFVKRHGLYSLVMANAHDPDRGASAVEGLCELVA
jgi:hypothetical protein